MKTLTLPKDLLTGAVRQYLVQQGALGQNLSYQQLQALAGSSHTALALMLAAASCGVGPILRRAVHLPTGACFVVQGLGPVVVPHTYVYRGQEVTIVDPETVLYETYVSTQEPFAVLEDVR